jgi:hypothetical protein
LIKVKQRIPIRQLENIEFPVYALDGGLQELGVYLVSNAPLFGIELVDCLQECKMAFAIFFERFRGKIRHPGLRPFNPWYIVTGNGLLDSPPLEKISRKRLQGCITVRF